MHAHTEHSTASASRPLAPSDGSSVDVARGRGARWFVLLIAATLGAAPLTAAAQDDPFDDGPGGATAAPADESPASTDPKASESTAPAQSSADGIGITVFHTPPDLLEAGKPTPLNAVVSADWQLERVWAGVRLTKAATSDARSRFEKACARRGGALAKSAGASYCELELRRIDEHGFGGTLEGELVQPPGVEYYIASRDQDGGTRDHFASPAKPYAVPVHGETPETLRASRLDRHHGATSRFRARFDWTSYGRTMQPMETVRDGSQIQRALDRFSDAFWATTVDYTYRPLGVLYAFGFGVTILRGTIPTLDGNAISYANFPDPGMNAGFGEVDFELHRNFSAAGRINLGATEAGFAAGVGAKTRIGPRHATHLELGFDWMTDIGGRYWMSFAWTTIPRVPMAFTVEATEHPATAYKAHDARGEEYDLPASLATRLMLEVGVDITEQFTLGVRGGYANRVSTLEAGFVAGASASYSF